MRDPYEVLGVPQGASMDQVNAAYRELSRRYADDNLKNDLVMYYIIQLEGLKTSGDLYEGAKKELLLRSGVGYTIEYLEQTLGKTQVIISIMDIQVQKTLLKYVTIVE